MKFILVFIKFITLKVSAQIAMVNHYPTMQPIRILDDIDLREDIAFAYSVRLLNSNYNGPIIRLRRDSDDIEEDFYCGDDDKIDINAIDTWRSVANVHVVTVYDQSGIGRNASQTNSTFQPLFITNATQSYWVGDSVNDILIVDDTFNELIENGANATILSIIYPQNDREILFGAQDPAFGQGDRWSAIVNWPNDAYFDPGFCCGPTNTRATPNSKLVWDQYTFIRRDDPGDATTDRSIIRINNPLFSNLNADYSNNTIFDATNYPMGIGGLVLDGTGTVTSRHSNTRFTEFIMYNKGKTNLFVDKLEKNQLTFWGL